HIGSSLGAVVIQAEGGVRDDLVTGVQTCALPIWRQARQNNALSRVDWKTELRAVREESEQRSGGDSERARNQARRRGLPSLPGEIGRASCGNEWRSRGRPCNGR